MGQYIYILMALFVGIELCVPRTRFALFNNQRLEDGVWYFLNEILFSIIIVWISSQLGIWSELRFSQFELSVDFSGIAIPIQILFFIVFMDGLSFTFHYLCHRYDFLWQTHLPHHTTTELTFLSAFRHSWSQKFFEGIFFAVLSGWMDFNDQVRIWGNTLFVLLCMFQHLNVCWHFPDFIEEVLITPRNHFWHHAKVRHSAIGQNFGLLFTHWDKLLGTHYNPPHFNADLGLFEGQEKHSFLNKVFNPFDVKLKRLIKRIF